MGTGPELHPEQGVFERWRVSREAGCSERRLQGPDALPAGPTPVKVRSRSWPQSSLGTSEFTLPGRPRSRMSLRPESGGDCDGRAASNTYAIRRPWGNEMHRVMSPLQFLARLAALIPRPRHPLIRFHGVFTPHSSWREKVVPIRPSCCRQRDEDGSCYPDSTAAAAATTASTVARIVKSSTLPVLAHRCSGPAPSCAAAIARTLPKPPSMSRRHVLTGRSS